MFIRRSFSAAAFMLNSWISGRAMGLVATTFSPGLKAEARHAVREVIGSARMPGQKLVHLLTGATRRLQRRSGRSTAITGLEIGSFSLKAVRVDRRGAETRILGYAYHRLPGAARPGRGRRVQDRDCLARALRRAVEEAGGEHSPVVLLLGGSGVLFAPLILPPLKSADLRRAIRWQVAQMGDANPEAFTLDYRIVGRRMVEGREALVVQVAAATRELVEDRVSLLKEAGLTLGGLGVAPTALEALLGNFGWVQEGVPLGVADLGAQWGRVYVFQGSHCEFAREFRGSGEMLTASLTDELQDIWNLTAGTGGGTIRLSWAQAERAKRDYALPEADPDRRPASAATPPFAAALVRPAVERLVLEIRRSLDFAAREVIGGRVKRLALMGGSAKMIGLAPHLTSQLGTSVKVFTLPEAALRFLSPRRRRALQRRIPELAVAMGLALQKGKGIHLRSDARESRPIHVSWAGCMAASALVLLAAGLLRGFLGRGDSWREEIVRQGQAALQQLESQVQDMSRYGGIVGRSASPARSASGSQGLRPGDLAWTAPGIWKALGYAVEPGMQLDAVQIKFADGPPASPAGGGPARQGELRLSGVVRGSPVEVDLILLQFLTNLESLPFFQRPVVSSQQRENSDGDSILRFSLACPLQGVGGGSS